MTVTYRAVTEGNDVGFVDGRAGSAGSRGPGPGGGEQDGDAVVRAALRIDGPIARAGLDTAPAAAARVGAVTVPQWQAGVAEVVLPVAYRDVLEVLADAGQPLRAKQIAAALGLGGEPRSVEGLRLKLKRL